jgi:hypothetical protein
MRLTRRKIVMTEELEMQWDDWKEKYDPIMIDVGQDDGTLLELDTMAEVMQRFEEGWYGMGHVDPVNIPKYVWTITSGDGWQYTSTGFHYVDRESYLICRNPWTKENEACMYEDWGTYCEHCDRCVHSCKHDDEEYDDEQ